MYLFIFTMCVGLLVYFIPTFIAKGKRQFAGVLIVNLFFGWTGIIWILCIVWASTGKTKDEDERDLMLMASILKK